MSAFVTRLLPDQEGAVRLGLAGLSGVMWLFAFAPYGGWPLAWGAMVPLLFACHQQPGRRVFGYGLIAGFIAWAFGYPWIALMADRFMGIPYPAGHLVTAFHGLVVGALFGACLWAGHRLHRATRVPLAYTLPVAFVAVWSTAPNVFFCNLGHATWRFPLVLQPIELFGTYSLDFVLVLFGGLGFDLVRHAQRRDPKTLLGSVPGLLLVVAWLVAGAVLQSHWETHVDTLPTKRIGIVQPHRPSSFRVAPPEPGYTRTRPFEMALSEPLAAQGAELIVWPEGHSYFFTRSERVRGAFEEQVAQMGVPLMMHDKGPDFFEHALDGSVNSSILITPDQGVAGVSHKRMLVPFGEYYPFTNEYTWLKPYRMRGGITAGRRPRVFETAGMRVQPVICYEMQFGRFVADAVGADGVGKIVIAQTNDGWFGGDQVFQHNSSNILRAIENRVPVVHVVNDGPSEAWDAAGRLVMRTPHLERGAYVADVPYDAHGGGTFFSAHPDLFVNAVRAVFLALAAWAFARRRREPAA